MIGFFASSPYFGGGGEIAPTFAKNLTCPHLASCHDQTAEHMKTVKYSFKRGIITLHFGEKYTSLPLPICGEPWQMCWKYLADYHLLSSITQ